MKKRKLFLLFIFLTVTISRLYSQEYVVVLSLDGFRSDYVEKYNAHNIKSIAEKGVRVKQLIASNPTKTFPNHYTIVTGLYPDNHGLVANAFYAPELKKEYSLRNRSSVENGAFYGGEPIWNTAQKSGLKTASFYWVGSEANIQNRQPDIWKAYDETVSFPQRIDSVISWLNLPKSKRPRLTMLYYHQPDNIGHSFGPDSKQVEEQVHYVDKQVGILYRKLMELPFASKINLIVLSDHGMRSISLDKAIVLEDYIKKNWIDGIYGGNPFYFIKARTQYTDSIYNALKHIKHLRIFKHGKAPKRLHIGNHAHSGDFAVMTNPSWSLFVSHANKKEGGTHGYLNTDKQMSALFVATGSSFKKGYKKHSIQNIDIYNLIAKTLRIQPAPNDGKFRRVKRLLKK